MLAEHGNISVGIDLGRDYSQIAFCSKSDRAPLMVMQSEEEKEENDYLIRTPVDLFSLVERKDARGVEVLYQFLKECFALLKGAGSVEHMTVMVTMHEMKGIWADVIRTALLKLGIPSSAIFLQGHLESFYAYLMNQKKELLTYHVALLEYERDCITAWHFWLERKTKPVLAKTEKCFRLYLDNKEKDAGTKSGGSSGIRFCIKIWRKCLKTRRFLPFIWSAESSKGNGWTNLFVFCAENGEVFAETISTPWEPAMRQWKKTGRRPAKIRSI